MKPTQELALEEPGLSTRSPPHSFTPTPKGVWRIGMEPRKCRVQNLACVSAASLWCGRTHAPGSVTDGDISEKTLQF